VSHPGCCHQQGAVDLAQEIAGRRRLAEVDADTVRSYQTPVFTLLGRVVVLPARDVPAERVRFADELLERVRAP